jgi:hypothetical protein
MAFLLLALTISTPNLAFIGKCDNFPSQYSVPALEGIFAYIEVTVVNIRSENIFFSIVKILL